MVSKRAGIEDIVLSDFPDYSIRISDSIYAISEQWDANCGDNVYVSSIFNKLLEQSGPLGYAYYYVLLMQNGQVKGLIYCQHKTINLDEDYRAHTHSDDLWSKLKVSVTKFLFRMIKHEMLICGNVILTGEYGIRLAENSSPELNKLIPKVLSEVKAYIKNHKQKTIQSILLKDFYETGPLKKQDFSVEEYTAFNVQPDMILTLDPDWNSYSDYLSAVKSKYRVKFKKVKKKGTNLVYRTLNGEQAQKYNSSMYKMYKDTADRATFSMFTLDQNYFCELKETLGDKLVLTGVFLEEELVAFYTYVKNGTLGDAHFLGYNVQLNMKYQIYFNILLQLVETAIEEKATYLNLSRTALEIKSSVGAEPYEMKVHIKYHRPWINKRMAYFLSKFVPENDWLQRKPFK